MNVSPSRISILLLLGTLLFAKASLASTPFLWKVEGEGAVSHIFGTIHLPNPEVTNLPASVEQAFTESDAFFAELPMAPEDIAKTVPFMMLPQGQHARDILSEETYRRADQTLRRINPLLSMEGLGILQIWALSASLPILEQQLKYPTEKVLDEALYNRAVQEGKLVGGLETIEEQVSVFDALTLAQQVEMLEETLKIFTEKWETGRDQMREMIDWYLSGDSESFGKFLQEMSFSDPELNEQFTQSILYDRNRVMAERIGTMLREHPERSHFFAIGAGHFYGETSIARLLEADGFTITRISQ